MRTFTKFTNGNYHFFEENMKYKFFEYKFAFGFYLVIVGNVFSDLRIIPKNFLATFILLQQIPIVFSSLPTTKTDCHAILACVLWTSFTSFSLELWELHKAFHNFLLFCFISSGPCFWHFRNANAGSYCCSFLIDFTIEISISFVSGCLSTVVVKNFTQLFLTFVLFLKHHHFPILLWYLNISFILCIQSFISSYIFDPQSFFFLPSIS